MSQPITVTVNGAISAAPASSTALAPSLRADVMIGLQRTYSFKQADSISINSPVSFVGLGLGSITKVRFVFIRVIGASITITATSAAGSAVFNVSDEWMWHSPNEGDQFTAITLKGVSDLEYLLLGD